MRVPASNRIENLLGARRTASLAAADTLLRDRDPAALSTDEHILLEGHLDDAVRYDSLLDRMTPTVTVKREEPVYRIDGPHRFYRDLVSNDPHARDRLGRHMAMERETRDVVSSALGGIVPPAYLVEMAAPIARAGRPFADLCTTAPLGDEGTQAVIPVASGSGAAGSIAATENTSPTQTDVSLSSSAVNVSMASARATLSAHLMQRGGPAADLFCTVDLLEATNTALDLAVLTGAGTGQSPVGVLANGSTTSVTYTDGTPSALELLPKIASAAKQASANRRLPITAVTMHSRRWYWLCAAADANGEPLIGLSTEPPCPGSPFVGTIAGAGVLIDDNIPTNLGAGTNEDRIIVSRPDDNALAECEPSLIHTPAVNQTQVTGCVWFVFSMRRPASTAIISGTGLVDPGTW